MTVAAGAYVLDRARPEDADAIGQLDGLGDSTRRLLARDLPRDDRPCLVARTEASGIVGMAMVAVALDEAHLLDVAVAVDHRRQGIGTALVAALRDLARGQLGATAMTLEVRESNWTARALYRRLGFAEAGLRPDYYPTGGPDGAGEAAVIMWDRPAA